MSKNFETPPNKYRTRPVFPMFFRRDTQGGWGQWTTISKLNGSTWLQTTKALKEIRQRFCFCWKSFATNFYMLVYETHFCFNSNGLSSSKRNHLFLNGGWLPWCFFGRKHFLLRKCHFLVDLGNKKSLNIMVSLVAGTAAHKYVYAFSKAIFVYFGACCTIGWDLGGGRISAESRTEANLRTDSIRTRTHWNIGDKINPHITTMMDKNLLHFLFLRLKILSSTLSISFTNFTDQLRVRCSRDGCSNCPAICS